MNVNEAYIKYCAEHGLCNRVVFERAFYLGVYSVASGLERTLDLTDPNVNARLIGDDIYISLDMVLGILRKSADAPSIAENGIPKE